MKILFLTLCQINNIEDRGIYTDLIREFINRNHEIYIASPIERRYGKETNITIFENCEILQIKTLNIQKTNLIEKGIGTLLLEMQFDKAIKIFWSDITFDLILYSTPPITFNRIIEKIKKRCSCPSYLMLKDIFPQNAVDLSLMKKGSLIYKLFRCKEKKLYTISDRIGCMSPANRQYIIDNNSYIDPIKVELCPNAISPIEKIVLPPKERLKLLTRFGIPCDKTLFIYGGNLGKPQGIDFLLRVIEANEFKTNSHVIIVGNGTEYPIIETWFNNFKPKNSTLINHLPKQDYDALIKTCNVGLIFLDSRFTIPNFPSRLLSYLENKLPVLLATDKTTDIGRIAESGKFGLWSESGDLISFMNNLEYLVNNHQLIEEMGQNGYNYLLENYTVDKIASQILAYNN